MNETNLKTVLDTSTAGGQRKLTKYVRVRSAPDARFVEFDFAIGDPLLFVELIMPPQVFKTFCENNDVSYMTDEQMETVDAEMSKWRYGDETLMSENHNHSE
jgi:phenol hydroxylase P0 protein